MNRGSTTLSQKAHQTTVSHSRTFTTSITHWLLLPLLQQKTVWNLDAVLCQHQMFSLNWDSAIVNFRQVEKVMVGTWKGWEEEEETRGKDNGFWLEIWQQLSEHNTGVVGGCCNLGSRHHLLNKKMTRLKRFEWLEEEGSFAKVQKSYTPSTHVFMVWLRCI